MNLPLRELFSSVFAAAMPPRMTQRKTPDGRDISLLGYGAMRLPTVDGGHANPWAEGVSSADIDFKTLKKQIHYLFDHGVTLFDTAPAYCRGRSEALLGRALEGLPREKYFLSTKLSNFAPQQMSFEASKQLFEQSLENLRTDYVDFYMIHNIGQKGWANFENRFLKNDILPWLFEQKRKGRIRNLGWSYHGDPRTIEWVLKKHDDGVYRWDFALIQLNYIDWRHGHETDEKNLNAEDLYNEAVRRGMKVLVMEPLLGGRLAKHVPAVDEILTPLDPEATPAKWALRFAGTHPGVMSVLSGMTYQEHIEENTAVFSPLKPLSKNEFVALEQAAEAYLGYGSIPCNLCNYCMPCPYGLDIPGLLSFRNQVRLDGLRDAKRILALYEKCIPDQRRRADRCIGCGICNGHCPQHIDIPSEMDELAAFIEGLR